MQFGGNTSPKLFWLFDGFAIDAVILFQTLNVGVGAEMLRTFKAALLLQDGVNVAVSGLLCHEYSSPDCRLAFYCAGRLPVCKQLATTGRGIAHGLSDPAAGTNRICRTCDSGCGQRRCIPNLATSSATTPASRSEHSIRGRVPAR